MNTVLSFLKGAQAILLMGIDGIVIEYHGKEEYDSFEEISIEMSQIVKEVEKISSHAALGGMREMIVYFEKNTVILQYMTSDVFLALLLNQSESVGKSRFALQNIAPDIQAGLSK